MQKKQCIIAFFDNILLKSTKIRTKSTMNICTRKEKFRYEKNFILFTLMCLLVFVCNNMNVSANTDNIELEAQTYAKSQYKSYCITSNNNSDAQINITNIKLGQESISSR